MISQWSGMQSSVGMCRFISRHYLHDVRGRRRPLEQPCWERQSRAQHISWYGGVVDGDALRRWHMQCRWLWFVVPSTWCSFLFCVKRDSRPFNNHADLSSSTHIFDHAWFRTDSVSPIVPNGLKWRSIWYHRPATESFWSVKSFVTESSKVGQH